MGDGNIAAQLRLQLSGVTVQCRHRIRPVVGEPGHFLKLLNPDILVNTADPGSLQDFLFPFSGINAVLRHQKSAVV